jgi:hypothetical protein
MHPARSVDVRLSGGGHERRAAPQPEFPPPRPARLDPDTILSLQQSAGNCAIARVLGHPAPWRVLARYEAGEHARFGGAVDLKLKGLPGVTEGDLIALADLYENPADVLAADPAELARVVALIHRDRKAFETGPISDRVRHEEWEAATAGRTHGKKYLELAAANEAHFAPRAPGTFFADLGSTFGGMLGAVGVEGSKETGRRLGAGADRFVAAVMSPPNHKREWEKLHRQALDKAAGKGTVPEEAIVVNGFAAHFLTDAFSAGHLLPKTDVMERAGRRWDEIVAAGSHTNFAQGVAKDVLKDATAAKTLAGYELDVPLTPKRGFETVTEANFAELLVRIARFKRDKFLNAFAKIVHDKLDEEIATGKGIEVTNEAGDTWPLAGDKTLGFSPKTLEVARRAVQEANQNLEDAAKATGPVDYVASFERVWRHVPRPTDAGGARVNAILDEFTNADDPDTRAAFVALTVEELPVALSALEAEGYMRKRPAATAPAPATP